MRVLTVPSPVKKRLGSIASFKGMNAVVTRPRPMSKKQAIEFTHKAGYALLQDNAFDDENLIGTCVSTHYIESGQIWRHRVVVLDGESQNVTVL